MKRIHGDEGNLQHGAKRPLPSFSSFVQDSQTNAHEFGTRSDHDRFTVPADPSPNRRATTNSDAFARLTMAVPSTQAMTSNPIVRASHDITRAISRPIPQPVPMSAYTTGIHNLHAFSQPPNRSALLSSNIPVSVGFAPLTVPSSSRSHTLVPFPQPANQMPLDPFEGSCIPFSQSNSIPVTMGHAPTAVTAPSSSINHTLVPFPQPANQMSLDPDDPCRQSVQQLLADMQCKVAVESHVSGTQMMQQPLAALSTSALQSLDALSAATMQSIDELKFQSLDVDLSLVSDPSNPSSGKTEVLHTLQKHLIDSLTGHSDPEVDFTNIVGEAKTQQSKSKTGPLFNDVDLCKALLPVMQQVQRRLNVRATRIETLQMRLNSFKQPLTEPLDKYGGWGTEANESWIPTEEESLLHAKSEHSDDPEEADLPYPVIGGVPKSVREEVIKFNEVVKLIPKGAKLPQCSVQNQIQLVCAMQAASEQKVAETNEDNFLNFVTHQQAMSRTIGGGEVLADVPQYKL